MRAFLQNIADWWEYDVDMGVLILSGAVLAVVGLLGLTIYAAVLESREWEAFAVEHSCKVVARSKGGTSTGYGITANGSPGMVTVQEPDKTAYLCDDGITYWR